jgi:hypothetical protein
MKAHPREHPPLLVSAVLVVAAVVVLAVAYLASRSAPAPEPTAAPTSEPEPEPEPEPQPPGPVTGEYELAAIRDVSVSGRRVFGSSMPQDAPVVHDEGAVGAFVDQMAAWIDRHLTDLQGGGEGLVAGSGLEGPHELLTLTDPDHPVELAQYAMVVYAREAPEWARTNVVVARADGSVSTADLVFLPGEQPALVAAEGDGAVPSPVAAEGTAGEDEEAGG